MAATKLLSSAFATPGRRAHGSLGTLPAGFTWGDEVWGRLNVAEHVETSAPFLTKLRARCFGMGTVKITGQPKGVTALFEALAFVHRLDRPDIVVVLGRWCVHGPWLKEYYGNKLTAKQLRKAREHTANNFRKSRPNAVLAFRTTLLHTLPAIGDLCQQRAMVNTMVGSPCQLLSL